MKINVNAISPGPVRTDLGGGLNDEFEALLSDDNRWFNAQSIEVAGGLVI